MFGKKRAKRDDSALRVRKTTTPTKVKKPELSSAEKTKALANSRQERRKSAPAI